MKKKITVGLFVAYILFWGFLFIKTRFIIPNQQPALQSEKVQEYKKLLDNAGLKGNLTIYKNKQRIWQYTTVGNAKSAYLINSVQKELTAGMIMRAVSENKLSLDDKVNKFYPDIPNGQNISVLILLEITSGLDPAGPMEMRRIIMTMPMRRRLFKARIIMNKILASGIIKT